jgi:hypothetical protein
MKQEIDAIQYIKDSRREGAAALGHVGVGDQAQGGDDTVVR